jgi:protein-S-isoprenylcysteine O-methyltransferase Ste14
MDVPCTLLWITLAAEALAAAAVGLSIARPAWRIWPPPGPRAWQRYFMWLLFTVSSAGVVALGIVDWGSLALVPGLRFGAGLPLWAAGNGVGLWSMAALGLAPTFGEEGPLVRRGPYRFSRNPQYVAFMAALVGWALVAGSARTLAAALAGTIPLVLVPFAEEPWLAARHGPAYEEYRRSVPRFIALRRKRDEI